MNLLPLFTSDSVEWYTPPNLVGSIAVFLDGIDLDPCAEPAKAVPATTHYVEDDDGLARDWSGKVFMNPPYGSGIDDWVRHLVNAYRSGQVTQAIALLPARTDTAWMGRLRDYPRCFIRGRIRFSGEGSAPFPSVLVYLGGHIAKFAEHFEAIGDTYISATRNISTVRISE